MGNYKAYSIKSANSKIVVNFVKYSDKNKRSNYVAQLKLSGKERGHITLHQDNSIWYTGGDGKARKVL